MVARKVAARVAVAMMPDRRAAPATEPVALAAAIAALEALDLPGIRVQFRNHTGRIAPARMSRPLLLRVLAYRIQADALGDLRPDTRRLLARIAQADTGEQDRDGVSQMSQVEDGLTSQPAEAARPSASVHRPAPPRGTVLVREWQGTMERVSVVGEGYSWRDRCYPNLSAVALAITGTKWNGRRFFGLDRPAAKAGARP